MVEHALGEVQPVVLNYARPEIPEMVAETRERERERSGETRREEKRH